MTRLAAVLLIAVATAMALLSDLLIRARELDGVNGINAGMYDGVSGFMIGTGIVIFILADLTGGER